MPFERFFASNTRDGGLIIVVGQTGSGKTALFQKWAAQYGFPYLNICSLVSGQTMGSSLAERPNTVQTKFQQVIESAEGDVVLCDNLELLFASELSLDPLRLLKQVARKKKVVAAWTGSSDGATLSYAVPGHDEYRAYAHANLRDVTLSSVNEVNCL